jgi:hypothetical protein
MRICPAPKIHRVCRPDSGILCQKCDDYSHGEQPNQNPINQDARRDCNRRTIPEPVNAVSLAGHKTRNTKPQTFNWPDSETAFTTQPGIEFRNPDDTRTRDFRGRANTHDLKPRPGPCPIRTAWMIFEHCPQSATDSGSGRIGGRAETMVCPLARRPARVTPAKSGTPSIAPGARRGVALSWPPSCSGHAGQVWYTEHRPQARRGVAVPCPPSCSGHAVQVK